MKSNLQIISGKFGGKKLFLPTNARPTQNKARSALFNILTSGVMDFTKPFKVWDAFAGSGAFGAEVLSRYENATVLFTDTNAESIKTIHKNTDVFENATVIQTDALGNVKKYGADMNLIFVDAPYDMADLGIAFVRRMESVATPGLILIWEVEDGAFDVKISECWEILRDKKYGRARFLILEYK